MIVKKLSLHMLVFILAMSCHDETTNIAEKTLEKKIQIAKQIYEREIASVIQKTSTSLRHSRKKAILWDRANLRDFVLLDDLIVSAVMVPVQFEADLYIPKNPLSLSLSNITYLLIYEDQFGAGIVDVVTSLPDQTFLKSGHNADFSGIVIVENLSGRLTKGYLHSDGKIIDLAPNESINSGNTRTDTYTPNTLCVTTLYYTCFSYEGVSYGCNLEGSETTCFATGQAGSGVQTNYSVNYTPYTGGGTGTYPNPPISSPTNGGLRIDNEVTDPCIKGQINRSLENATVNEIASLIKEYFGTIDVPNLYLLESDLLPDGTDATTGGSEYHVEITFNSNILPNASQEYILATVYHEYLHAIFFNNGLDGADHHGSMAKDYVDIIAAALIEHFPYLENTLEGRTTAQDLAWGGLQETAAWNNLSTSRRNSIAYTNSQHRTSQKGSPCLTLDDN